MRKKAVWKLRLTVFLVILGGVISGCGPIRATECVTRITENCKAGFAEVNDISMYYEIHGLGEPLIVLHGAAGSIENMRNAINALSRNYRVIAVDTRGHGRSTDSDQSFSYDLFAKDVIELMDLLEIDKAHIVGLSDGGITGLAIAITYPDRINKLVTIGANFSPEGLTDQVIDRMSNGEFFENIPSSIYEKYAPDPSKWPNLIEKLRQMILSEPNYTQDDLGKIQAPVLVMLGENDQFIRVDHTEELHRMIANSTLFFVPKAGHNVFEVNQYGKLEAVDAATGAILEFLVAE